MHYYKRHIGDYAKKAGRLSMIEHGAYTLLLDACYDRERFPTKDDAIKWCWARTAEEVAAVEFVLIQFFDFVDGVYKQHRIEDEIKSFNENSLTNKRIAIEREAKRKEKIARNEHEQCTNRHEPPPNHKPLTINQEPYIKTLGEGLSENDQKEKRLKPIGVAWLVEKGVSEQHAIDWLKVRKTKRAPLTVTAWSLLEKEAAKAGITPAQAVQIAAEKSWQSFVADYMQPNANAPNVKSNALRFTDTDYNRGINQDGSF